MEELLVITACLYQKGCHETATRLYNERPALQEFAMRAEREVREAAGPVVTEYVVPTLVFAAGGTGVVRVIRNVDLKYNRTGIELIFKNEF